MRVARARALALLRGIEVMVSEEGLDGVAILELKVQMPRKTGGDFRVVAKGITEDGRPLVAFGGGSSFEASMADLVRRSEAEGLKWRDDKPYEPR
jgi:hypothetical protein